jgi:Ca2+-binding EF-hand superfamily protein
VDSISCCLYSVLPCNLLQLSKCVLCCSLKTARLYCIFSLLTDHNANCTDINNPKEEEEEEGEEVQRRRQRQEESTLSNCERHDTKDELITYNDINMVMSSLGVDEWRDIQKQNHDVVREAHDFIDSKDSSLEELKEAFYVFDRNEDGFITAFELWSVLRRLRMKEGMLYEDCEEMIRVYDKDGDGRISFGEFKDMMEQAL